MGTNGTYYNEIIGKLEKLCRKKYLGGIFSGIVAVVLVLIIAVTLFSLFELIAHLNSTTRTVLFFTGLFIVAGVCAFLLILPLLRYFNLLRNESYFQVAKNVGDNFPDVKDDLLNSMQLVNSDIDEKFYSHNLIDAAFKEVYDKTRNLKFELIIDFKRVWNKFLRTAAIGIAVLLLFLFLPGMKDASYRLINFNKEFVDPPKFRFQVFPGDAEITKGEDVLIKVKTVGKSPKEINLAVKNNEETDYRFETLKPDSLGSFNLNLTSIRTSFKYYASAGNIASDIFRVDVVDGPIIKTLDVEIYPPPYTKLSSTVQKDNGNVTSLVGSKIKYKLSSTKNLSKAFLQFSDSTHSQLKTNGENAEGSFILRKDNQYYISLIDENGIENSSPITYQVKALHDAYPTIEMVAPNKNVSLSADNRVELLVKLSDDYGFSKLVLNYRLSASRYETPQEEFRTMEIPLLSYDKEMFVNYVWNLTQLSLGVDDVVSYYLEVFDNDNVSGPKSARTVVFTIRVPSLDEILSDANQVQNQSQSDLEKTLKEAEVLHKTFQEIDREMKKDKEKLSWEEKEKVENALDKYEELQQKTEDISKQLQEMQNKLQENNLLSKETLEKYMELQKLMDEFTSEEMKKALEQLRNTLQQMNRNMTQNQLENFQLNEEKFRKGIERTLNLLKRIQIEQKVDELLKRTEQLAKEQNELKEKTEQSNSLNQEEKNELSRKQNKISEDMKKLGAEMEKLQEKMNEMEGMPQEEMEKMSEEFEKQMNEQLSKQAQQNIQQNKMQSAVQQQQQIASNMDQLNQQMQEMQNSMRMQNQMQTFTDMMKILNNLLEVSKKQEELKNETRNSEPNSSSLNDKAETQDNLKSNLLNLMKQMADLSQKTFAITPEMGKALGEAVKQMQRSIQSMQNRNGSMAAMTQGDAMMHLNEAATMMKGSMEAMMQGGGQGGGMMSLMQQLQQLSGQQMNVNNLTQMLQQMKQGKLSSQQQAELQRLSQQQQMIHKSLEQLNEEAKISGSSKKLPADLESILHDMQEVLTDMNTEKLDDKLIQKQEHILSKLLDAQRSINERDYEKERNSRTGENIVRNSPSELNLNSTEEVDKLREELNRAVQEGYVKDYEELILKYYEALRKAENK